MPRAIHTFVLVALVTLFGGCSGGAQKWEGVATPGMAPDFALERLDGETVRLSDSAGKVRLLDFWATWCAPCREEIPMLKELQETYGDRGFVVLAIAEEESSVIRAFVEQHAITYTNLIGTADVAEAYQVPGLPTAYLLDGEGKIVETFVGPKPLGALEKQIRALLEAART